MKKLLIVVDMQNDFITGALGTPEAQAIVPKVAEKIKNWDGDICVTMDTHSSDYLNTREGRKLPVPHCILGTHGWHLNEEIYDAMYGKKVYFDRKDSFGDYYLPERYYQEAYDRIEFCGVCTDICVISNAIIFKPSCRVSDIAVDASCCAGTTPEMHQKALDVMESCQITILEK